MFLYARIMLGNIELLSDIEDIRKELRVLPENLNEAYVIEIIWIGLLAYP